MTAIEPSRVMQCVHGHMAGQSARVFRMHLTLPAPSCAAQLCLGIQYPTGLVSDVLHSHSRKERFQCRSSMAVLCTPSRNLAIMRNDSAGLPPDALQCLAF